VPPERSGFPDRTQPSSGWPRGSSNSFAHAMPPRAAPPGGSIEREARLLQPLVGQEQVAASSSPWAPAVQRVGAAANPGKGVARPQGKRQLSIGGSSVVCHPAMSHEPYELTLHASARGGSYRVIEAAAVRDAAGGERKAATRSTLSGETRVMVAGALLAPMALR
jgi:hypothetical protein